VETEGLKWWNMVRVLPSELGKNSAALVCVKPLRCTTTLYFGVCHQNDWEGCDRKGIVHKISVVTVYLLIFSVQCF